jgi:chemotaxis protein histidine kinase CheA
MLSEYREVFLEELEEQLQLMDDEILNLEQEGDLDQVVSCRAYFERFIRCHGLRENEAANS